MKRSDSATPRQAVAVAFAGLLSPLIRRFPRVLAETAGRSCWLAIGIAMPLLPAAVCLMRRAAAVLREDRRGPAARGFFLLYALWLVFYSGFLLRSGAERFVTTVYPGSGSARFLLCMAAVCTLCAAGGFRPVARSAMLLRPLLLAAPLLIFLLSLRDLDFAMLLPLTGADLPGNLRGAADIVNLCAASGFLLYSGAAEPEALRPRDWAGWGTALIAVLGTMTCACIGLFGPALTAEMAFPFFLLARDAPALGTLERVEPLVVAVWVFADVVFLSALLRCAARLFGEALRPEAGNAPARAVLACALPAATAGLLLPSERAVFRMLSDRAVPAAGAVMNLALPLLAAAVSRARRRLRRSP